MAGPFTGAPLEVAGPLTGTVPEVQLSTAVFILEPITLLVYVLSSAHTVTLDHSIVVPVHTTQFSCFHSVSCNLR